ncbi:MAG: WYL domain-containing transcriptional regulator [Chthoniobacter sp.]|uniref:helix-turn-helix transcriptional regulator n=1 Tax=Chthoniobacter sp. TaxID=2510640 RepID=UPI0032A52AFD
MMRLHQRLIAGDFPNCRKLADELEVSTKTIQRDIDFMRDRLGLPIEYDQLHFGFIYTETVTHFPSVEVSEGEIVALFVAQKALEQYRGTSFEKPLRTAFGKITEGLKDRIGFQWGDVDSAISFRGIGTSVADLELFETVSRAVLDSHEVEFEYKKLGSSRHETRRVQPYHLGCVENQWYLFGFDLVRRQIRTFALPRMRKLRDTRSGFRRPADFSITQHLSDSFGVFRGKARHRVLIHFDAFAARLVSERQWHPTQKIKRLADGEIELSMTLGSLEEVERWILSWGEHASVLEPAAMIRRIREVAETLGRRYAK